MSYRGWCMKWPKRKKMNLKVIAQHSLYSEARETLTTRAPMQGCVTIVANQVTLDIIVTKGRIMKESTNHVKRNEEDDDYAFTIILLLPTASTTSSSPMITLFSFTWFAPFSIWMKEAYYQGSFPYAKLQANLFSVSKLALNGCKVNFSIVMCVVRASNGTCWSQPWEMATCTACLSNI